jgi:hypothetical protein
MVEVIDISRNKETGELEQFTVLDAQGQPQLIKATKQNVLLYDPENKMPFDDGISGFFNDGEALMLSERDPELYIVPTEDDNRFAIYYDGKMVETMPKQSVDILEALYTAIIDEDIQDIISVYDDIMSSQVRRNVINAIHPTFEEGDRIEVRERGWLIDDLFLIDWSGSMYAKHDDPTEPDKIRKGDIVQPVDRSYEFVQLRTSLDITPVTIRIGDTRVRMTEREIMFLAKTRWVLNRREYHPDRPFWYYVDRFSSVDWKSGEPERDDAPSFSSFSI